LEFEDIVGAGEVSLDKYGNAAPYGNQAGGVVDGQGQSGRLRLQRMPVLSLITTILLGRFEKLNSGLENPKLVVEPGTRRTSKLAIVAYQFQYASSL
jgi:hypothetical protein